MYKVVINNCFGGYGVSEEVCNYVFSKFSAKKQESLREEFKKEVDAQGDLNSEYGWDDRWTFENHLEGVIMGMPRHDPLLIEAIENVENPNGFCAQLKIYEIEEDRYYIREYDGMESIITPKTISWVEIR